MLSYDTFSCDTFICYRGTVNDGISEIVAAQIYKLIKQDRRFGKVFFAPEAGSYNFLNHARPIISNVKKFIIVLCPDFFQDFYKDGKPNPDSATYEELKAAFDNRDCVFYPVYVNGFNWNDGVCRKLDLLKQYFDGQDVSRLHGESGTRLKPGESFTTGHVNEMLNCPSQIPLIDRNALISDLKDCSTTILGSTIPMKPESLETDYYAYLYYNSDNKPFFPKLFLDNLDTLAKECCLPEADFGYWNMDISTPPDNLQLPEIDISTPPEKLQHTEIDISALCYGTMIAHHWLTKDCIFHPTLSNNSPTDAHEDISQDYLDDLRTVANGGMRLLIAMRSPKYGSWPSRWDFTKKGVEGTINQTTLSLSTLLSCDFLSDKVGLDLETFRHRQQFIHESINWLLKAKKYCRSPYGSILSWGYMASNSESAVLPTSFAFDTLLKYWICLEHWLPKIRQWDREYAQLLEKEYTKTQNALCGAIRYFDNIKTSEGAFPLKKSKGASVPHTAMVLKSLVAYYMETTDSDQTRKSKAIAKRLITCAFKYLLQTSPDTILNLSDEEIFETFTYKRSESQDITAADDPTHSSEFNKNSGEQYENCGELLYIVALSKAISLDFLDTPENRKIVRQNITYVFSKFRQSYVKEVDIGLIIQGKRTDEPWHPIYNLYYYRMALYDMLCNLDQY